MQSRKESEIGRALEALEMSTRLLEGAPSQHEMQEAQTAALIGIGHAILAVAQEVRG